MCQVHTGAYVSLLAPENPTIPLATQERLPRTWYILHVVPITMHTHAALRSIGKNRNLREKKRKERKGKERKGKERKSKKTEKERREKKRKDKKRQDEEAREGKEKQMSY